MTNCQGKWFLSNFERLMADKAEVVEAVAVGIVITRWPSDHQLSQAERSEFFCPVCQNVLELRISVCDLVTACNSGLGRGVRFITLSGKLMTSNKKKFAAEPHLTVYTEHTQNVQKVRKLKTRPRMMPLALTKLAVCSKHICCCSFNRPIICIFTPMQKILIGGIWNFA